MAYRQEGLKFIREKDSIFKEIYNALREFENRVLIGLLESGDLLFLFAENDFSLREFNNDFRYNFLEKQGKFKKRYSLDIIKNANHIYTETKWQDELLHNISTWLKPQGSPK